MAIMSSCARSLTHRKLRARHFHNTFLETQRCALSRGTHACSANQVPDSGTRLCTQQLQVHVVAQGCDVT